MSRTVVTEWEAGRPRPRVTTLDRIAALGEVTTDWLWHGTTPSATRRRAQHGWAEAVAALEAVWRDPSRRRLVMKVLRALAEEGPNAR